MKNECVKFSTARAQAYIFLKKCGRNDNCEAKCANRGIYAECTPGFSSVENKLTNAVRNLFIKKLSEDNPETEAAWTWDYDSYQSCLYCNVVVYVLCNVSMGHFGTRALLALKQNRISL